MLAISVWLAMAVQQESIVTPVIAKYGFKVQSSRSGLTTYETWDTVLPTLETPRGRQGGQATAVGANSKSPHVAKEVREIQFLESTSRLATPPVWKPIRNRFAVKGAFLGSVNGVFVYGFAPVWDLVFVQKQLKLEGGEDWRKLAAEGILADDETSSRSCTYLFKDADDDAVHAITAVMSTRPDKAWTFYRALGEIRTSLATAKLIEGYSSVDKEVHRAAMYALIHEPLRKEAKAQYFEMFVKRLYVAPIARGAAIYGWKEALPLLRAYLKQPIGGSFVDVLEAERTLSGNPVPVLVKEALLSIRSIEEPAYSRAIQTLIRYPDRELIIAYALRITRSKVSKDMPQVRAAKRILESLPSSEVEELRARLKDI